MPAKRDVVINPFVSEYVYDCIVNATVEQKRYLNAKCLRICRTIKRARAFSVNSSLEDKALMLTKLGISWAWVFNMDKEQVKNLKEESGDYTNVQLIDRLLAQKHFVITDKQMMLFANIMASNIHSETWMLNRQFLQASYRIKEWKQSNGNAALGDAKDSAFAAKNIAKIMMNAIMYSKYADGIFDVSETEISVLLFMFSKEKEFVPLSDIKICFNGIFRNFKINEGIKKLIAGKYIEKGEGEWDGSYRTTSWGVDMVMKFEKRVFALENY